MKAVFVRPKVPARAGTWWRRLCWGGCATVAACGPAWAQGKPALLKLCYDEVPSYPWILDERQGLNIVLIQAAATRMGVKLDLAPKPWKRCLEEVRTGVVDGIFSGSYSEARAGFARFPMVGDKPDERKAMMVESYSLYRLKGSAVQWDGKRLQANGVVGAQPGFSVLDQLKLLGARVDTGAEGADINLRKLMARRVVAVALMTRDADKLINHSPEMVEQIEKVQPPLDYKAYYLMLSHPFAGQYAEFSQRLWSTIGTVRESVAFKQQVKSFK